MRTSLTVTLALVGLGAPASGQIQYISQARSINAGAGAWTATGEITELTRSTAALGVWDEQIDLRYDVTGYYSGGIGPGEPPVFNRGFASQTSALTADAMRFSGIVGGRDRLVGGVPPAGMGYGATRWDVSFTIASSEAFWARLIGSYPNFVSVAFNVRLRNLTTGTDVFYRPITGPSLYDLTYSGTLAPGAYRFTGYIQDGTLAPNAGETYIPYSIQFVVPSPAVCIPLVAMSIIVTRRRRGS